MVGFVSFIHAIRHYQVLQYQQQSAMEDGVVYDINSGNNQILSQKDLENSKISSKETQIQEVLASKTIRMRSNSSEQSPNKAQYYQEVFKHMDTKQKNIIFYEDQIGKSNSSLDIDQTNRKMLKRKEDSEEQYSDQYQDEVQQLEKLNQKAFQKDPSDNQIKIVPIQTTLKDNTVLISANVDLLIKQIVPKGYKLTCYLQVKKGLFGFSGAYRLFLGKERQFLMAAKKETFKYYSNFLLSRHPNQIHRRSQNYIGRLESNFVGTQFKLFSVKSQVQNMKLLINYNKNLVGFTGIRRLRAVKLNPECKTQKYFSTLSDTLERNERSKLVQFSTAQPVQQKGKFRLDFRGKVKMPSSKNFILKDESGRECLLFGKVNQSQYIVQVSYPLTIFEAFGLCLSSLDSKLMVN